MLHSTNNTNSCQKQDTARAMGAVRIVCQWDDKSISTAVGDKVLGFVPWIACLA
jgi:hypothetical protein